MREKQCSEYCQLFRWNKCNTKRKDGLCDNIIMYDSDDLEYRRLK